MAMNRPIEHRLRKLESGGEYNGPRVQFSAFPLPDDPLFDEAVDQLLASGEAVLRRGGLVMARELTSSEWVERCRRGDYGLSVAAQARQ
jgi:hypothetical protein